MNRKSHAGFSFIEVAIVILLIGIISRIAVVPLRQTLVTLDADKAANLVVAQIRYARQIAVDQRRNVTLTFTAPNRIEVVRQDGGGATTVMSSEVLPPSYQFGLPGGGLGDTPDGYGNAAAVTFGGATSGTFLSDGTFVNAGGIVTSGSVFTISAGNTTSRAVTLTGASGRTKKYSITGTTWTQR